MKILNLKIKESIVFFLFAVVISVSSCEKIPLGLGGLWTLTDYELHNGANGEIVPKTDETDEYFVGWVGEKLQFYSKGEAVWDNSPHSYSVSGNTITMTNTDAPYGVPAVTSHMMLQDGLLVSYDFAKLPSYEGEEFPDIWIWFIFERN